MHHAQMRQQEFDSAGAQWMRIQQQENQTHPNPLLFHQGQGRRRQH